MVAPISAPMLQIVAMPAEKQSPRAGLAEQLVRVPHPSLGLHTCLHTRALASFFPSLALSLWPMVNTRTSKERPRGQSSVSQLRVATGWVE